MPFAEVAGGVAVGFELFGQGRCLGIKPLGHAALVIVTAIAEIGSDAIAVRVLPRGERDAGG